MNRSAAMALYLITSALACAHSAPSATTASAVAEAKDVRPLDVRDAGASPNDVLYISGVAARGDLVVAGVRSVQAGDSLNVLVSLGEPAGGGSGRFQYTLEVLSGVRTVTFGNEKTVIWTRRE
jgi:hypothetical protein